MADFGKSEDDASSFNFCPFCELKLSSEFQLGSHLLKVHNILVNTALKRKHGDGCQEEHCHFSAKVNSDVLIVGNKMKILRNILQENFTLYIDKMLEWVKCQITTLEFDQSVRPLFNEETIIAHNEFLASFLKQIRSASKAHSRMRNIERSDSITETNVPNVSVLTTSEEVNKNTQPVDIASNNQTEFLTSHIPSATKSLFNKVISDGVKITSMKRCIPDEETLYALAVVHAWENGCTSVNKKIVPLLHKTTQEVVKLIRDIAVTRRKTLKVKADGTEYNVTQVDPEYVDADDKFKYEGKFQVEEILDALKSQPNLLPLKGLCRVIMDMMNWLEKYGPARKEDSV